MANKLKSVETALEWTKQIIALASGILVVSGTFIKDLFNGKIEAFGCLIGCWVFLCVCILFGLLFMGSLCSLLDTKGDNEISIYSQPAKTLGLLHFATFFIAMVFFAVFALRNISDHKTETTNRPQTNAPSVIQIQVTNAPIQVLVTNAPIQVQVTNTPIQIQVTNGPIQVQVTNTAIVISTNFTQWTTNYLVPDKRKRTEISVPLFKFESR